MLRTTLTLAVAVLACWFTPTAVAAEPAAAECAPLDLSNTGAVREHADAVTDVFAGRVREVEAVTSIGGGEGKANQTGTDAPSQKPDARTTGWRHTVVVQVPFRSAQQPGDRVVVSTKPTADRGLGRLKEGATYLFFVTDEQGRDALVAAPCSGTQLLPRGLGASLRDALHKALDERGDEEPMPDYSLTAPEDGARSTPSLGRLAAPGAAVALIGVLGLLLLARMGARRT